MYNELKKPDLKYWEDQKVVDSLISFSDLSAKAVYPALLVGHEVFGNKKKEFLEFMEILQIYYFRTRTICKTGAPEIRKVIDHICAMLRDKSKPLAFVGKGVCFDTGGYSLKPAKFMEDMTYDMAGSAAVVGLMKTLALRKAKINAVGVVGLVENMVSGRAQRPGDIVKSFSGKTIEVLNTDAEGRLVLADALTYTEKKFKPKFIVDLATLTGAIIVSLGSEYAGLFSNSNKLSEQIIQAGQKVSEKSWRMPMEEAYNKQLVSHIADIKNIGGAYINGEIYFNKQDFYSGIISHELTHLAIWYWKFIMKIVNFIPEKIFKKLSF